MILFYFLRIIKNKIILYIFLTMIYILKDSFAKTILNSEIKFSDKNRKLSKLDYFEDYLIFIDNSIHIFEHFHYGYIQFIST